MAFSPDGIDEMNRSLVILNGGKPHQPIYKVRVCEPLGNKFKVGTNGNKAAKYVEAAKGTNLFLRFMKQMLESVLMKLFL